MTNCKATAAKANTTHPTYGERLDATRARTAQFQNGINANHSLSPNTRRTRDEIANFAANELRKYPQYEGHFDEYVLVEIKHPVRTKAGTAFEGGDMAIGKYTPGLGLGSGRWIVYSVRTGMDTSVPFGVRRVESRQDRYNKATGAVRNRKR